MPGLRQTLGHWHSIDLGSHADGAAGWHAVALLDEHVQPPAAWHALPSVLDSRRGTRDATPHSVHLGAVGLTGAETMIETALHLATIHPLFWS